MQPAFTLLLHPATRNPLRHRLAIKHRPCARPANTQAPYATATTARPRDQPPAHRLQVTPVLPAVHHADQLVSSGRLHPSDHSLLSALTPSRAALFAQVLANRTRHLTFVLDGVHGPHNLAAIARSCDAWGIQDLHFISMPPASPDTSSDSSVPLVVSPPPPQQYSSILERFNHEPGVKTVSKNCHKWLTFHEYPTSTAALARLRASGYKLFASSLSPHATPIDTIDVTTQKCAFIFGNETHGVTRSMLDAADGLFTIPMVGFVESMNVSVAVATTASLTVPRCRPTLSPPHFLLPPSECQILAAAWLRHRPPRLPTVKKRVAHSRGDVTRLGSQIEMRILRRGVFASPESPEIHDIPSSYWQSLLRLHGDTGSLVENYFIRRKFGALGDRHWKTRCDSITYVIAGSHALTSAAAITNLPAAIVIDRRTLMHMFRAVCKATHALYQPHFDSFGQPIAPLGAPEAERPFRQSTQQLIPVVAPVLFAFASECLEMSDQEVRAVLASVDILDAAHCVTDTLRCPKPVAEQFHSNVSNAIARSSQLAPMISERNPNKELVSLLTSDLTVHSESKSFDGVKDSHRHILFNVSIRLFNAAYVCSELHQALWERAQQLGGNARVRSMRVSFMESVACEAYSEMQLLQHDVALSQLRVAAEWYRPLWILKNDKALST